jgi:hypothetical protein
MWQSTVVRDANRPDRRGWLAAVRHPTPRNGVIALGLLGLPWAVALVQALRHQHLDSGAVGIVVALSVGLPALWLAWAGYLVASRSSAQPGELTLAQVADQLAAAVSAQWEAEAAVRRLNDPYPLPVSWVAADPALTDAWDSLVKLASSGAGWPAPSPEGIWVGDPEGLAGTGNDLVDMLARVPTGRLIALGEPGAGKTMLMVRLVLDLLARRAAGGPVPILASLASWPLEKQGLRSWLAAQLLTEHPALAAAPPVDRKEPTRAAALLDSGLILMILDGLDEIPEQIRGSAISRINDSLRPGEHVVVTCRGQQYLKAIRPTDGTEVSLRGAAAVQLRPLDANIVRSYLIDDASGPIARARWDPVIKLLGTEAPVGQALNTPLMVGLARAIYNPRPGELAGTLRDPVELCSPALADRAAVESLLFDAFIPAAYRHDSGGRWKARDAEKWLVFLARRLESNKGGSPDLAWWELEYAIPGDAPFRAPAVGFGIANGVAAGAVLGAVFGVAGGVAGGAVFGVAAGVSVAGWGVAEAPACCIRIGVRGAIGWVVAGAVFVAGVVGGALACVAGAVVGAAWFGTFAGVGAVGAADWGVVEAPAGGIRTGVRVAARWVATVAWITAQVVAGAAVGAWGGAMNAAPVPVGGAAEVAAGAVLGIGVEGVLIKGAQGDLTEATSPKAVLAQDRRAALLLVLAGGVVGGTAFGAGIAAVAGVVLGVAAGVVAGAGLGLWLSTSQAMWPYYLLTVGWLAFSRRLPRSLMGFLADAHQRGVLRQVGAVYQFRHIELQHRLATKPSQPTRVS